MLAIESRASEARPPGLTPGRGAAGDDPAIAGPTPSRGERRDASWSVKPPPTGLWVRFPGTPPTNNPNRGARSLGEHRRDKPDQASSILAPRTTLTRPDHASSTSRPAPRPRGETGKRSRLKPGHLEVRILSWTLSEHHPHVIVAERNTRQAENLCPSGRVSVRAPVGRYARYGRRAPRVALWRRLSPVTPTSHLHARVA